MVIYLPCKLGETFEKLKFVDWVDGKRVCEPAGEVTLNGFSAFDCATRCLSIPTIVPSRGGFLKYDPLGEFGQEFVPKYKVMLNVKRYAKLCDMGFPGSRLAHLGGISIRDGILYADFVTKDRAEHLLYPIKEESLVYYGVDDVVSESKIIYAHGKVPEAAGLHDDASPVPIDYSNAVFEQVTFDFAMQGV